MKNLQNALATYYQNELFVKGKNSEGGAASYNPDPMQLEITLPNGKVQKLTDEYNLYQLSHAEKTLLSNQRNEYEEIIDFDNNNFLKKSTKALTDGWREIQERQGSDTAKRSRAMSVIGDNYANSILIPRIEALLKDPNGTYLSDMKIEFDATEGITQDMKDSLDKRWEETGEDRTRFLGGYKRSVHSGTDQEPVWIYLNKTTAQGMIEPFFQPESFLELKRQTPKHQVNQ